MNIVFVEGGSKQQREIAHRTVAYCIDQLMPKSKKLEIEVQLTNIKNSDAVGFTCMMEDRYHFELEIEKNQTLREFIGTITHEMVHVKQYYKNQMDDQPKNGHYRWNKEKIDVKTPYSDLPWEKEAYELQYKLADELWSKNII